MDKKMIEKAKKAIDNRKKENKKMWKKLDKEKAKDNPDYGKILELERELEDNAAFICRTEQRIKEAELEQ